MKYQFVATQQSITEGELRTLTALHGERSVTEFATELDRSLSYTSELVDRLGATGSQLVDSFDVDVDRLGVDVREVARELVRRRLPTVYQ